MCTRRAQSAPAVRSGLLVPLAPALRLIELRRSKESFYRYAIKMVLKHNQGRIRDARLKIDGHGDRQFRREFRAYLSREVKVKAGPPVIRDLKIVDSERNILIQLADLVAGALRRNAERIKEDHAAYREVIETRLEDVWVFGYDP